METQWSSTRYSLAPPGELPPCAIVYDLVPDTEILTETNLDGKRWYVKNGRPYPSITTVLSATDVEGKKALSRWRAAVGQEKADQISHAAATNGTNWHNFCEMYLSGKPTWPYIRSPDDQRRAITIASVLNANIRRVLFSETRVTSDRYQVAGRMDLGVQLHDGRLAIVDFKTGKKQKSGNRLDGYALQTTFYADAMTERLGQPVDAIIIVQLLPDQIVWQESSASIWSTMLMERVKTFATQVEQVLTPPPVL